MWSPEVGLERPLLQVNKGARSNGPSSIHQSPPVFCSHHPSPSNPPHNRTNLQAQESLKGAKTLLDHLLRAKEQLGDADGHALAKALARTAVANAVALAKAERALQGKGVGGPRVQVGLAWSAHRQVPVVGAEVEGGEGAGR